MSEDDDNRGGDESLLPYDIWTQDALRGVVARALSFAGKNGLPGGHFFYITFLTGYVGVSIPPRLLAQYKREMTIVLQHQFWDLKVDEAAGTFSVGLSFGGIPSTLVIPLAAVVNFSDPHVHLSLAFSPTEPANEVAVLEPVASNEMPESASAEAEEGDTTSQVVQLDAFRRRPPQSTD